MPGSTFKNVFNDFYTQYGETVVIIRNYGTSQETSSEYRALKNNEKNKPSEVMFQFPEPIDIEIDDIIKLKLGRDLWQVYDVEDVIIGDVYVNFEAKVKKVNSKGLEVKKNMNEHAVFNAPIYGGVQVGGQNNTQKNSIEIRNEVDKILNELHKIIKDSNINELQKDDAEEALTRISKLSKQEQTEETISRIHSRIEILNNIVNTVQVVGQIAGPLLLSLSKMFGS